MKKFYTSFCKYWAIAKINFTNKLVYKVDMLSEILFLIFIFTILFFLHKATAKITPTSQIEYLSLAQTMWIIFFANIIGGDRGKGVTHMLKEDILSGQIAYQLNRPYSYTMFHFAQHIGTKMPSIILGGLCSGTYLYCIIGFPNLSIYSLLLGFLMLCIGMVISFLMLFCIGLCAFWIGDIDPLRWIYMQIMVVTGGAAIPLAFFPSALKNIILLLPFSNIVYGAARIIVGCQHTDLVFYLKLQIFWLIIMFIVAKFLFKRGAKNVNICGG